MPHPEALGEGGGEAGKLEYAATARIGDEWQQLMSGATKEEEEEQESRMGKWMTH